MLIEYDDFELINISTPQIHSHFVHRQSVVILVVYPLHRQLYSYHALCAMLGLSGGGEMGPEVSSSGDALMICVNISGFISILTLVELLSSSFRDE